MFNTDVETHAADIAASPQALRQLIHSVSRASDGAWAAAAGDVRLVGNDLSALSCLVSAEARTWVELRGALGLTSSSITELADRLERAGLVTRSRPSHDRRLVRLNPTAQGRRTVDRALAPLDAKLAQVTHDRDRRDLERSVRFLLEINNALIEAREAGASQR